MHQVTFFILIIKILNFVELGKADLIENQEAQKMLIRHRQNVIKLAVCCHENLNYKLLTALKQLEDLARNNVHFYHVHHIRGDGGKRNRNWVSDGAGIKFSKQIRRMVGSLENFVENEFFRGRTLLFFCRDPIFMNRVGDPVGQRRVKAKRATAANQSGKLGITKKREEISKKLHAATGI